MKDMKKIVFCIILTLTLLKADGADGLVIFDANRDLKVSKEEYNDFWQRQFTRSDLDQDQQLTKKEWGGMMGEATSASNPKAAFYSCDKDNNQTVSLAEHKQFRLQEFTQSDKNKDDFLNSHDSPVPSRRLAGNQVLPSYQDVNYGNHESQLMNFWQVESDAPIGVLLNIHGGGWMGGKKQETQRQLELKRGFHHAAITYPLVNQGAQQPAMLDSALRAVQFLRFKAIEWNIDPKRIVVTGGSAGGCSSLLVALHDDIADTNNQDPVKRFSSRVIGASVAGAQTTLDPFVIKERIGPETFGNPMPYQPFGAETAEDLMENWAQYKDMVSRCSPISHLSADDPPLYLFYNVNREFPTPDSKNGIHSPIFGEILQKACQEKGVICHLEYWEKDRAKPKVSSKEFIESLLLDKPTAAQDFSAMRAEVAALGDLTDAPVVYPAETFESDGVIKPIFYQALPYQGKETRVFAWLGIPEVSAGQKVPAVVLVHGGGGTAFKEWVKLWNQQGFAAISIAVEGQIDQKPKKGEKAPRQHWQYHPWSGPQRMMIYGDTAEPIKDQWMYHAVADTVLANSLLRSDPKIDTEKIGLMGISWGGVITSTAIGIDNRFAFAIPTYGCGDLANAENMYGDTLANNAIYRQVWDPLSWLERASMPSLWYSWTGDTHFPMDCLSRSYQAASGKRLVSLVPEMQHGHQPAWLRDDSYEFAKSIVSTGSPWCQQTSLELDGSNFKINFHTTKPINEAQLVFTKDTGNSAHRKYTEVTATFTQSENQVTVSGSVPKTSTAWFINLHASSNTNDPHGRGVYASSDYQIVDH